MAIGDLGTCSIGTNGLVATIRIEGFSTSTTFDLANKPPAFTVVSKGFSGSTPTTVSRTVKAVAVFGTPTTASGYLVAEFELDSQVYDADDAGGSGTNPVVTVQSGWATDGSNNAAATSNHAVTNQSTLAYPKIIARWANPPCQRRTSTWFEEVVAFHHHPTSTHKCGVGLVKVIVTDSASPTPHAEVVNATFTSTSRQGTFGPAETYPLWRAEFDAGDFSYGAATRHFEAYPVIGDNDSVFKSAVSTTQTGARMAEVWLDPSNAEASGLAAAVVYVDSTSTISGTGSESFKPGEFAIVRNGSGTIVNHIKAVASPTTSSLKFNYLHREELFTMAIDNEDGDPPQFGDLVRHVVGDDVWFGEVLAYSSGLITYRLVDTPIPHNTNFEDGDALTFLYREEVFEDYQTRGTADAADDPDPVPVSAGPLPTGTGTSITAFSGIVLSGLSGETTAGVDINTRDGSSTSPYATVGFGLQMARFHRNDVGGLAEIADGCVVKLQPGDYLYGPSTDMLRNATGYWCVVESADTNNKARLVGVASNSGLYATRVKLRDLVITSPGRASMLWILTGTPSPNPVLWVDACVFRGIAPIAGIELWGENQNFPWAGVYVTGCDFERYGIGPGGIEICRDTRMVDIGGDILSHAHGVFNVEIDKSSPNGNPATHGDVGQYVERSYDNIIWYCVRVQRMDEHQPVPNMAGAGQTFQNGAFVNIIQQVLSAGSRSGGFGMQTVKNAIYWNVTIDALFGLGYPSGTMESISIRSCFFHHFVLTGAHPYSAWMRNNYFYRTGDQTSPNPQSIAPGVNARNNNSLALSDLFLSTTAEDSTYYTPKVPVIPPPPASPPPANPMLNAVPSAEVVVGYDTYGVAYSGEIGGAAVYAS